MVGKFLKSNITSIVKNNLTKLSGFQKNTNFEIEVSLRDSVKMRYRFLNSFIDSTFKFLVRDQTFNKIRTNAKKIAPKTEQDNNADITEMVSP